MSDPTIARAHELGQSLWLDNLSRRLLDSGELVRLRDLGVTGITSNPTIFQKAISESSVYRASVRRLLDRGREPAEIMWDLMVEDVQAAADVLRPVYDRTAGEDGFVSIEVSPDVADDAQETMRMARDLRSRCARPNVMVKIPATGAGVEAIRGMVAEGASINVTLVFSVSRYEEVVEAFISGLERLAANGGSVDAVRSVASFFVSRVDAKVDRLIDRVAQEPGAREPERLRRLRGSIGIANSKLAYRRFQELHAGPRWERLARAGAHRQRCLWASTSVKDPAYPDTMYAESLIGPETIDTLPEKALEAFIDHGRVRRTLDEGVEEAREQLRALAWHGIDLDQATAELEREGVEAFARSYRDLLAAVAEETRQVGAPP